MNFMDALKARCEALDSLLCVGLDPHAQDLPEHTAEAAKAFCLSLVEATRPYAACFKPNAAFFEQFGPEGVAALKELIEAIGDVPVLLDVKRGDIFSTASAYAHAAYESLGAGAVTVNAYMGHDAVAPFLAHKGSAAFVLCRTSNPSAYELQDLSIHDEMGESKPLYVEVAHRVAHYPEKDRLGLVVGATRPQELTRVRQEAPDLWILAPGVGAQGGDLEHTVQAGVRADGLGLLISVSRGISRAEDPAEAAASYVAQIRAAKVGAGTGTQTLVSSDVRARVAKGLLHAGCVRFGDFTLKSGLKSPIYLDLRRLVGYPKLLADVAVAYGELMETLRYDVIAPLPYAALPIGTAVSLHLDEPMVYPRKEVKKYGTKALVEGVFSEGDVAIVLDDLATTGGSKIEGIEKLHAVGLAAKDVVVLIDRESGAVETMAEAGVQMHAVFTLTELLALWEQQGEISTAQADEVRSFLVASREG